MWTIQYRTLPNLWCKVLLFETGRPGIVAWGVGSRLNFFQAYFHLAVLLLKNKRMRGKTRVSYTPHYWWEKR